MFEYVLYSHFCLREGETDLIKEHLDNIKDILEDPKHPGMLVLFYDPSWLSLLNTVGHDFDPMEFSDEFSHAREFQKFVDKEANKDITNNGPRRIRLITVGDLYRIVNNLRGDRPGREATRLRRFLTGSVSGRATGTRYDTSKVVEAIVRLRQIGSGIPVFRIDWDALFNEDTLDKYLRLSISRVLEDYRECNKEPSFHSFVLSAGYVEQERDKPVEERSIDNWLRAFATRVFPALLATRETLNSTSKAVPEDLENACDPELARKFYGLNSDGRDIEVEKTDDGTAPKEGITSFGSHPFKSVVSGSLLCLSDGAILDLPPFSNFQRNVMWIDDHLKYALHRDLGHFSQDRIPAQGQRRYLTARIPGTYVLKDRPDIEKTGHYTLGTYLPTVLRGTIVDAWIQPKPAANLQHIDVDESIERGEKTFSKGVLTRALANALRTGRIDETLIPKLKDELRHVAMKRIAQVANQWKDLSTTKNGEKQDSLAALWVTNPSKNRAISDMEDDAAKQLEVKGKDWIGWGLFKDPKSDLLNPENLNPKVSEDLNILIDDAINYIEWTLEWPRFIQSVRAVPQGELRLDLQWKSES
uniref:Uncharacterized protein n=1 Tax=Candidatus Kentrum sp. LFY TaxID=2126342 RepID=A0A450UEW1_9GAMM|nr:MAG: hypothetical protein BECKLFY1418A_GA0070994_10146 [Candidatus Kentron sp. LFY]